MPEQDAFATALRFTLQFEGGYSNHPADPGGATMRGVTQRTYDAYRRGKRLPPRSVRSLTEAEMQDIYRDGYWEPVHCAQAARPLAVVLFDTAVNYGVGAATRFLQSTLDLNADGVFGPKTLAAMTDLPWIEQKRAAIRICDARIRQRQGSRLFGVFGAGWLRRDRALKKLIIEMQEPN